MSKTSVGSWEGEEVMVNDVRYVHGSMSAASPDVRFPEAVSCRIQSEMVESRGNQVDVLKDLTMNLERLEELHFRLHFAINSVILPSISR